MGYALEVVQQRLQSVMEIDGELTYRLRLHLGTGIVSAVEEDSLWSLMGAVTEAV